MAIPDGAKVKVAVGEEVEAGTDLLEVVGSEEEVVDVSARIGGLKPAEKRKLAEILPGMKINDKVAVYRTGGLFPKKIFLPVSGEATKLDEFGNLYYKGEADKARKISCPVGAKVVKNDGQSLELEFRAKEYTGRGIYDGKVWAAEGIKYVDDMADLSSKEKGRVVLTEKADQAWLMKAEVVGIVGVVVIDDGLKENDGRINFKLPVLALEKSEWQELKEQEGEVKRLMINATGGRLLIII